MRRVFSAQTLPPNTVLITCSSHERRCCGLIGQLGGWRPKAAVIFHYDDHNPRRELNHNQMESDLLTASVHPLVLVFTEGNAVKSLNDNMVRLRELLASVDQPSILFDISVFTKRHLLMMLNWLDDEGYWDRMWVAYSEPDDYDVSQFIPLSFGLASFQQVPGFSACPDFSRAVHLVLFLGYEGDRAMAVYEHVEPMVATLIIPHPPFKPSWEGRTERFNADLLSIVGEDRVCRVDSIDPELTKAALTDILGSTQKRSSNARIVCPLGTKPQTFGLFSYLRECVDPPAIVYAGPLRHNHDFFSHGIGTTWLLKEGISQ